jgi:outer membrane protein assembly factor BamB
VVALVLIVCALTLVDNWPQWRGPHGQGVSDEKNLPLEWSPTRNIKWKAAIPGRDIRRRLFGVTESSSRPRSKARLFPALPPSSTSSINQVVKFPDTVGAERSHALKLISIDVETGKIVWERTVYEGRVHDDRQKTNSYASSTPTTDGY